MQDVAQQALIVSIQCDQLLSNDARLRNDFIEFGIRFRYQFLLIPLNLQANLKGTADTFKFGVTTLVFAQVYLAS